MITIIEDAFRIFTVVPMSKKNKGPRSIFPALSYSCAGSVRFVDAVNTQACIDSEKSNDSYFGGAVGDRDLILKSAPVTQRNSVLGHQSKPLL
jgi:hypothetical protein